MSEQPDGLGEAGARLWQAVTSDFELAEHELAQLVEACFVRDTIVALRDQVRADGNMIVSSQGMRLHPAIGEIRAQQLALARLLASMHVPGLDEDALPPSTGVRGVYTLGRPA